MEANLKYYGVIGVVSFLVSFAFCKEQREKLAPVPWFPLVVLIGWVLGASWLICSWRSPGYRFVEALPNCLDVRYYNNLSDGMGDMRGKGVIIMVTFSFYLSLFRWGWNWLNREKVRGENDSE